MNAREGTGEPIAQQALRAAEAFRTEGRPASVEPLGIGRIHDSLVLTCRGSARPRRYLLQRLNTGVFPDPAAVVENVACVTSHLRGRLAAEGVADLDRRVLTLVPARAGGHSWRDPSGGWWRAYVLIEGAASAERLGSPGLVRRTAEAFAGFARRLADLPPRRLRETLPGFHDTPARLAALAQAVERDPLNRARDAAQVIAATLARADDAGALARLQARGLLPERVVHNDTKVSNVLLDQASGEPLCVVDLDTVMPGLAANDFGDLVRSAAATVAEDAREPDAAGVAPALLEALATGYVAGWEGGLTGPELESLALAPQVIALELAARFLTDHLEGDRYFRVARPGDNLDRARVQLTLARALEAQTDALARELERAARG